MKRIIILVTLSGCLGKIHGQTAGTAYTLRSLMKLDLGLQGIGLSYEPRISNHLTADLCAGAGGSYNVAQGTFDYEVLEPALYFSVTPKYFYNFQKRINKGKSTQLNSGNYIGVRLKYVTPIDKKNDSIRNTLLTNIHWGIQRALGYHWLFNCHFGVGYAKDVEHGSGTVYPSLDFKFAYTF